MKKTMFLPAAIITLLAVLNAVVDSKKKCGCPPECWCQQPVLRHFRWILPVGHRSVPPEWKQDRESGFPLEAGSAAQSPS